MKIKVETIEKESKYEVNIGDIVCWTGKGMNNIELIERPCLVAYRTLVCLEDPRFAWRFNTVTNIYFMSVINTKILQGELRKMTEIETITLYPKEK